MSRQNGYREPKRIFLGAQEISGKMEKLNKAFRQKGIKSDFWCLSEYAFSKEKKQSRIVKNFRYHTQKRNESKTVKEKKHWDKLQLIDILLVFIYSLFAYDYYIYVFGHGLFFYNWYLRKNPEIEFKILKLFNKKMIMWFCGSDSRAPYCDVDVYDGDIEKIYEMTIKRAKNMEMIEKYMETIDFAASSHFHTKPYILYNHLCIPIDEREILRRVSHKKDEKLIILHAPSNKGAKGTKVIRSVMKGIRNKGYDFEYVEVSGVMHAVVLKEMARADIIIDQLYADFPMAGFSSEAAANGVPVIVCGYYAKEYNLIEQNPKVPVVYCEPDQLENKIIELICDKQLRERIGREEKEYINENSMSNKVADKFLKILAGTYPETWLFKPENNHYIYGCGIEKNKVLKNVNGLIYKYGIDALQIHNQPELKKRYMELYMRNDM